MAITATPYASFMGQVLSGAYNLNTETIQAILVNGYTFNAEHTVLADVQSFELATANGYTQGGQVLDNTILNITPTTWSLDADDLNWNAVGGDIGPTTGLIIFIPTAGDELLGYVNFDGAQSAGEDTQFKITFNQDGILKITLQNS